MEKHTVSLLVGAPPGYVAHEEGGKLTEAVRRHPYSVVLLDEIEKAHPDIFNVLLQVLDEGRLTDRQGRETSFRNTIIILTSNLGSEYIREQFAKLNSPVNGSVDAGLPAVNREMVIEETKRTVMEQLKRTIRPEFLNRIDETIMFEPLTQTEIRQVVQLQVASVQKMLGQNGITLVLTDAAIDLLTREGYDPEFGARPVKRAIQRLLLNDLSKAILAGTVSRDHAILVEAEDDHLIFSH
jgi:ATP-dependent Clp protease ATP-binding subunit ClpB